MANQMIERVARSLFVELGWEGVGAHPAFENDQELWFKAAKVAIEAMRKPTDEMVEAGRWPADEGPIDCWQAMIDCALEEAQ